MEERGRAYRRRQPEGTVLYEAVRDNLATLLAEASEVGRGLPRYVERDFARYLECGVLAHGFARVRCERMRRPCTWWSGCCRTCPTGTVHRLELAEPTRITWTDELSSVLPVLRRPHKLVETRLIDTPPSAAVGQPASP